MEKPNWMIEHEKDDMRRFDDIAAALRRIETTLQPISETYSTAGTMWKWLMGLAVLVSIIIGIFTGIMRIAGK